MKCKIINLVLYLIIIIVGAGCSILSAESKLTSDQNPHSFRTEIKKTLEIDYLLYLPEDYASSDKQWPLMLFLHGAGERGDDVNEVKMHGPPKLIAEENKEFPFVIVSPQCPEGTVWTSDTQTETLDALLKYITSHYRIDEDRVYLTGLSMGGYGTWRLACDYPHRFAAIAPICGGGDPRRVENIKHLPVWVFHGAKDPVVSPEESKEMVEALKKVGGNVKFTLYPDATHNSWSKTYENPELYEWLLEYSSSGNR